jgi:hypothetical protein
LLNTPLILSNLLMTLKHMLLIFCT